MPKITKNQIARRKALKTMAIGGAAATTAKELPERWGKPVIDGVLLPAHAKMSGKGKGKGKGEQPEEGS